MSAKGGYLIENMIDNSINEQYTFQYSEDELKWNDKSRKFIRDISRQKMEYPTILYKFLPTLNFNNLMNKYQISNYILVNELNYILLENIKDNNQLIEIFQMSDNLDIKKIRSIKFDNLNDENILRDYDLVNKMFMYPINKKTIFENMYVVEYLSKKKFIKNVSNIINKESELYKLLDNLFILGTSNYQIRVNNNILHKFMFVGKIDILINNLYKKIDYDNIEPSSNIKYNTNNLVESIKDKSGKIDNLTFIDILLYFTEIKDINLLKIMLNKNDFKLLLNDVTSKLGLFGQSNNIDRFIAFYEYYYNNLKSISNEVFTIQNLFDFQSISNGMHDNINDNLIKKINNEIIRDRELYYPSQISEISIYKYIIDTYQSYKVDNTEITKIIFGIYFVERLRYYYTEIPINAKHQLYLLFGETIETIKENETEINKLQIKFDVLTKKILDNKNLLKNLTEKNQKNLDYYYGLYNKILLHYIYSLDIGSEFKKIEQKAFDYGSDLRIPDCGETTVRNIIRILIWDSNKINVDLLPSDTNTKLRNFFIEGRDEHTLESHNVFAHIIANIDNIEYNRHKKNNKYEIVPSFKNIVELLKYLFKVQYDDSDSDEIKFNKIIKKIAGNRNIEYNINYDNDHVKINFPVLNHSFNLNKFHGECSIMIDNKNIKINNFLKSIDDPDLNNYLNDVYKISIKIILQLQLQKVKNDDIFNKVNYIMQYIYREDRMDELYEKLTVISKSQILTFLDEIYSLSKNVYKYILNAIISDNSLMHRIIKYDLEHTMILVMNMVNFNDGTFNKNLANFVTNNLIYVINLNYDYFKNILTDEGIIKNALHNILDKSGVNSIDKYGSHDYRNKKRYISEICDLLCRINDEKVLRLFCDNFENKNNFTSLLQNDMKEWKVKIYDIVNEYYYGNIYENTIIIKNIGNMIHYAKMDGFELIMNDINEIIEQSSDIFEHDEYKNNLKYNEIQNALMYICSIDDENIIRYKINNLENNIKHKIIHYLYKLINNNLIVFPNDDKYLEYNGNMYNIVNILRASKKIVSMEYVKIDDNLIPKYQLLDNLENDVIMLDTKIQKMDIKMKNNLLSANDIEIIISEKKIESMNRKKIIEKIKFIKKDIYETLIQNDIEKINSKRLMLAINDTIKINKIKLPIEREEMYELPYYNISILAVNNVDTLLNHKYISQIYDEQTIETIEAYIQKINEIGKKYINYNNNKYNASNIIKSMNKILYILRKLIIK